MQTNTDTKNSVYSNDSQVLQQACPDRIGSQFNLATDLISQVQRSRIVSSLDTTIRFYRLQLQHGPLGDENRALSLKGLANALFARFELSGVITDIDEAIDHHRKVLRLPVDQSASLNNLAYCLYTRFKRLGILLNLQEAIDFHRKALKLRPHNHPDRSITLNNLALCLASLYDQQGVEHYLDESISLLQNAADLHSDNNLDRVLVLLNLGDCFYARFQNTGDTACLHEAIDLHNSSLPGQGCPARPYASGSLARSLFTRFNKTRNEDDLERAINLERDTIQSRYLYGHSIRSKSLHNLGECLLSKFKLSNNAQDLDEAIESHHQALELRPPHHPDRSSSIRGLAQCLLIRSKWNRLSEQTDNHEAFALYEELMDVSHDVQAVFLHDIYAARDWVSAAEETKHQTTISAYQTLFKLLVNHLATLPSLTRHFAHLKRIMSCHAVDAFSACMRHNSPVDAVELLEQGRAVFWSLQSRLRSPLEEVAAFGDRGEQLARRFKELASPIRRASQHDDVWDLNTQLQDVVSTIRELPGMSRFLQPPRFRDLRKAATEGAIIIINSSKHGCDGLIVLPDRDPMGVQLRIDPGEVKVLSQKVHSLLAQEPLTREGMRTISSSHAVNGLIDLLQRLWNGVVFPVVEVLNKILPRQSRIWWCPTSDFVLLPLHAAGPYKPGQLNLPDLYISSYTLTLSALVQRARQIQPRGSTSTPRFLAVAVGHSLKASPINGVYLELESIRRRISSPRVALLTSLADEQATVSRTIDALTQNQFVHFACHATADCTNSFKSAFLLGDGSLEICSIMRQQMSDARFVYLSACSTTVGDAESPDEAIHLAAAMQFSGFQSVVGTIWAVSDAGAHEVADRFYLNAVDRSGQLDHTRTASALHEALKNADIPLGQRVLYVHFGA